MKHIGIRSLLLACLVTAAAGVCAPAALGAYVPPQRALYHDGPGGRYLLGGTWLFRLDPTDSGVQAGLPTQTSTDGWTPVGVPNAWNARDESAASQRGTVGWYRKDFSLPSAPAGTTWLVRFESVNYRTTVWLNGRQLGQHVGAYLPFELRLSGLLSHGVNRLVVRVDSRRGRTDVPPLHEDPASGPGGGWWNYGGLLREVYLRRVERVDIPELAVSSRLRCRTCEAIVTLRVKLANAGGSRARVTLLGTVGGTRARFPAARVAGGRTRVVQGRLTIHHPRLWEPGHPRLYPVRVQALVGGRRVASWSTELGVRSIAVDPNGRLLINGLHFALRGVGIHEDDPFVGAALTPGKRRRMFAEVLKLHANVIRSHYPLHPQFLEMADRAGVLVWEQVPVYRFPERVMRIALVRQRGLGFLHDAIVRDENHPSVLAWSIANELSRVPGPGQRAYVNAAVRLVRRLDPTRLVAMDIAGYPLVRLIPMYRKLDALGFNSYFGWYPGPYGSLLNRDVLSPYLDQLHAYYPSKAVFITEFGAEGNRYGPASEKGTYEYQDSLLRFHLGVYDSKPFLNGAFVWALRDFRVNPDWDGYNPKPNPPYFRKGMFDQYGNPKPASRLVARMFARAERRRPRP